jgi:hypothetical protein
VDLNTVQQVRNAVPRKTVASCLLFMWRALENDAARVDDTPKGRGMRGMARHGSQKFGCGESWENRGGNTKNTSILYIETRLSSYKIRRYFKRPHLSAMKEGKLRNETFLVVFLS